MKRYPFKLLDAYSRDDSEFFFGRMEEVDQLYEMVFQSDILLVYGASGTGKTSLIQCGLASRFQSHDWLALNIRRGNDLNTSLNNTLRDASGGLSDVELAWAEGDNSSDGPKFSTQRSLLARRFETIFLQHFKPIYLIFDQFEELYTLGDDSEEQIFVEAVQEILRLEQPVKNHHNY